MDGPKTMTSWLFQVPAGAKPPASEDRGKDPDQGKGRPVLHRSPAPFSLIVRKETYRLAVRAPEWIARAFRARKRPRIDRGQRSDPKRRPGLRGRDERDVSAVGRHARIRPACLRETSSPREGELETRRARAPRSDTSRLFSSIVPPNAHGEGGGDNPAEPLATRGPTCPARHQPLIGSMRSACCRPRAR